MITSEGFVSSVSFCCCFVFGLFLNVLLGVGGWFLGVVVTGVVGWMISLGMKRAYSQQQAQFNHRAKQVKEGEDVDHVKVKILTLPAFELGKKIKEGTYTSTFVVQTFVSEIQEVNGIINAMIFPLLERAKEEGRKADEIINKAREEGTLAELPALFGVPITVKEAFSVEGFPNTSGLVKRKDVLAEKDAIVVKNLKKAGAIILGLTNISELCMWYESDNPIYGRTLNPYHPMRIAGGSSGGEGSIIGSGASVIGVGADVGGSIRLPSFFNGIFGHKSTPLLVRNTGQYPDAGGEAVHMLSTGPMGRYASDLMPMLRIMAGPEENDNFPCLSPTIRAQALVSPESVRLEEIVVYFPSLDNIPLMMSKVDDEIVEQITRATEFLSSLGMKIVRFDLPELSDSVEMWSSLLHVAEQPTFAQRMGSIKGENEPVSGMKELVKFLFGKSEYTLPAIGLAIVELFPDLTPSLTKEYIEKITKLRKKLTLLLAPPSLLPCLLPPSQQEEESEQKEKGGVLFLPTFPTCAKEHGYPFLRPFDFGFTGLINALHFPATQIPMGLNREGLPIGFQVVGAPGCDPITIRIAMELEREFGGWVPPPISSVAK